MASLRVACATARDSPSMITPGQKAAMKLDDLFQSDATPGVHQPDSLAARVLPPNPPPPTRPTIPPPTCGTLPPTVSSVIDLLGGLPSGR